MKKRLLYIITVLLLIMACDRKAEQIAALANSSSVLGSIAKTASSTVIGVSEGANLGAGEFYSQEATAAIEAAVQNGTDTTASALYRVEDATGKTLVVTEDQLKYLASRKAQVAFQAAKGAQVSAELRVAEALIRRTGSISFNADTLSDVKVAGSTEEGGDTALFSALDISVLNTMVNQGLLQRYNGGYAVEHNGKEGIQENEIVPETINGVAGHQTEDVLAYVVNMVDSQPVIESVQSFVEANAETIEEEISVQYLEYLSVRRQGQYVLPDGQFAAGQVRDRREGFIRGFTPTRSLHITTLYGQQGDTVPYKPVWYQTGNARVLACEFLTPVEVAIPPYFEAIPVDEINYLSTGEFDYVKLHESTNIQLAIGEVSAYVFNGTPVDCVYVDEPVDVVINDSHFLYLKEYGYLSLNDDSFTIKNLSAASGTVELPDGRSVAIREKEYSRFNAAANTHFYPDGSIAQFWAKEEFVINNLGTQLTQAAGQRIFFYETGAVNSFSPAIDTEFEMANGQWVILKAGALQFLNRQGKAYYVFLAEPIELTTPEGTFWVKRLELSPDGKEIIKFSKAR